MSDGSEAAAHYRNVCRALVSEALELSSFLEKAWLKKNGDDGDFRQELQELALRDWVGTIHSLSFIIDFRLFIRFEFVQYIQVFSNPKIMAQFEAKRRPLLMLWRGNGDFYHALAFTQSDYSVLLK